MYQFIFLEQLYLLLFSSSSLKLRGDYTNWLTHPKNYSHMKRANPNKDDGKNVSHEEYKNVVTENYEKGLIINSSKNWKRCGNIIMKFYYHWIEILCLCPVFDLCQVSCNTITSRKITFCTFSRIFTCMKKIMNALLQMFSLFAEKLILDVRKKVSTLKKINLQTRSLFS